MHSSLYKKVHQVGLVMVSHATRQWQIMVDAKQHHRINIYRYSRPTYGTRNIGCNFRDIILQPLRRWPIYTAPLRRSEDGGQYLRCMDRIRSKNCLGQGAKWWNSPTRLGCPLTNDQRLVNFWIQLPDGLGCAKGELYPISESTMSSCQCVRSLWHTSCPCLFEAPKEGTSRKLSSTLQSTKGQAGYLLGPQTCELNNYTPLKRHA